MVVPSSENGETINKINSFALTATVRSASQTETQSTVVAPLSLELPLYGLDASSGRVGWLHPTIQLQTSGDHQAVFRNDFPGVIVKNFIVVADITWESSYASSGCGFALRAHNNGAHIDQYIVIITRMADGYALFTAFAEGKPANLKEIYANGIDPLFNWENGSTNRLAVVAQGEKITIYTNLTRLGTIDVTESPSAWPNLPPAPQQPAGNASAQEFADYQKLKQSYLDISQTLEERYLAIGENFRQLNSKYTEGFVSLAAVNSTGTTTCEFKNAWLWRIEP